MYDLYWAEGKLPLLADLSWPIQAHAIISVLMPQCNIPKPPTGEEDATVSLNIWAKSPMNMYIHIN